MDGLVPAVIQDDESSEVLMVGFMNREALDETAPQRLRYVLQPHATELWTKGETSGSRLEVKAILVDCDDDTCCVKVKPAGRG